MCLVERDVGFLERVTSRPSVERRAVLLGRENDEFGRVC
jgi:hypothetical protein